MTKQLRPNEGSVAIDGQFVRQQAKEAIHQFFRPLTAPFDREPPKTRSHDGKAAKV